MAKEILSIPLSFKLPEDRIVWLYTKDGNYAIKSGYYLAFHHLAGLDSLSFSNSGTDLQWTKI